MGIRVFVVLAISTSVFGQDKLPKLPQDLNVEFGVYVPYYESRAKTEFKARSKNICGKLLGLNKKCRTCRAKGLVKVVLREGFYNKDNVWVPPLEDIRDCPTCNRRKYLFQSSRARRFISYGLPPDSQNSQLTIHDLMSRMESSRNPYRALPKLKYEMRGRYAIVKASSGDAVFPLQFHLIPGSKQKFIWYLHDPVKFGPFNMASEFVPVPASGQVTEVYAGDVLRISGRRVVRIAGITVPGPDGKVLKGHQTMPDQTLRAIVRRELKDKVVQFSTDRRAQFTCRGVPLVFVNLGRNDFGESLIRRGLARRHPKHRTTRGSTYLKAENAARDERAGIWEKLIKKPKK
ncbi:MAG: thermonuclease family protein [Planctomycetota bacterium]